MKKNLMNLTAGLVFLLALPTLTFADEGINEVSGKETKTEVSADATMEVNKMTDRLEEINSMDISALSSSEKKELRKEVRSIRSDLKAYGRSDAYANAKATAEGEATNGFYISTGAAIIIVLLLILLL